MKRVSLLIFALLIIPAALSAQSCSTSPCNAANVSESAVLAALPASGATGSFIVNVPAGTGVWTSQLAYAVPAGVTSLTIQGQTTVSCTGTPGPSSYACTSTDNTIIEDGIASSSPPIWSINVSAASTLFRITGITVEPGTSGAAKSQGIVQFTGSTNSFRWDHSDIITTSSDNNGPEFDGQIAGVLDHNEFQCGNASSYTNCVRVYNGLLDTVGNGDGGFMAPTDWGSANFLYLEDNQFIGGYANDCADAGRMVERYNMFTNTQDAMQSHPTKDYAGPERGCRAMEFYHNYINTNATFSALGGQGGTWLVWGNTVANTGTLSWFWAGGNYRSCPSCNGAPAGDFPPNGWGQCGTDMNYPGNPGTDSPWDGNSNTTTGYPCLDNLGRGQQTQGMNGANFPNRINTVTSTQSWPQQYLEPIYLFDDTLPSSLYTQEILNQDYTTATNRDIYGDNTSCAGSGCSSLSTGTGYGTLAQRPTSCTAGAGGTYATSPTGSYGVAYWATDANSGNGELYACSATNTWTAIYEPYTYPHPLESGGSGVVSISPTSYNFGSVNVGSTSSNETFTVTNGSSSSMTAMSPSITGPYASYFANAGTGTCGTTLAASSNCTLVLNFTPGAVGIGFAATLKESYSGGDSGGSVSAGLTGTGTGNCSSPISVGAYAICSQAFAEASSPNTSVSTSFAPYGGNGVELFVEWCVIGCNANASQTVVVSDNVNSPETCFVAAPHSPYQIVNTYVPDYPIVYAYYCPSIPSGVTQISATVSGSVDFLSINAQEIKSGEIASTNYFETVDRGQNSGNVASQTASISTSAATVNANDLVTALVVNCGGSISATPGTGYTGITVNPSGDPGWVLEDIGVTATGTQTATTTWSSGTASGNCALGGSAPNTTWWGAIVALKGTASSPALNAPTISPASGQYLSPQTASIAGDAGAMFCYTTDGSTPTAPTAGTCSGGTTQTYSSPFSFSFSGSGSVKAIETETGFTNSSVTTNTYTTLRVAAAPGAIW